jgi:hypothetical protein
MVSVLYLMADKVLKGHIVSFRITDKNAETIEKMLQDEPIVGVKSVSQWFRKIGMDCLAGKVTYKNPEDMLVDATDG